MKKADIDFDALRKRDCTLESACEWHPCYAIVYLVQPDETWGVVVIDDLNPLRLEKCGDEIRLVKVSVDELAASLDDIGDDEEFDIALEYLESMDDVYESCTICRLKVAAIFEDGTACLVPAN
jgi:hypothetical protein